MSSEPSESPGFFDSFRMTPFPTLYEELKTPVTQDVLYVGWLTAFLTVYVVYIVSVIPTIEGFSLKALRFFQITFSLSLGLVIMACNFGQNWEDGHVEAHTPYRAGTGQEIHARIGVNLGLRSVNITLKALEPPEGDLRGETINYNERFSWEWAQGRAGFGPFAGAIQRNFRSAQQRGTPLPILWVAEYFTFDGEGIRFGRFYRTSGWYAHIFVWLAFPLWILTLIFFKFLISYGAITLGMTGASLVISALVWAINRNFIELEVPFDPPEGVLRTAYGVHWYLALIVGMLCMTLGVIIYCLNHFFPDQLIYYFGNDPLSVVEKEAIVAAPEGASDQQGPINNIEMGNMGAPAPQTRGRLQMRFTTAGSKRYTRQTNFPEYNTQQGYYNRQQVEAVPGPSDLQDYDQVYGHNLNPVWEESQHRPAEHYQDQGYLQDDGYNNPAYAELYQNMGELQGQAYGAAHNMQGQGDQNWGQPQAPPRPPKPSNMW